MYSEEIEDTMDKVSIYDWFERLTRIIENLMTKEYVVLSNVESYNRWIEFMRKNEKVIVSIIKVERANGSRDIEFNLKNIEYGE